MKKIVLSITAITLLASVSFAIQLSNIDNKLYMDKKKSLKRQLTLEDRKKLLQDTKALEKEKAHKTKSRFKKK